jgi:hypothetical protein
VDFLHYVTRINCLTGATISETHTTNKYIYKTKYDPPQYLLSAAEENKEITFLEDKVKKSNLGWL